MTILSLFLLLFLPQQVFSHSANLYYPSIPEDLYAHPKFRVTFLNGLPLSNATAQRWLVEGLHGGEDEFLERKSSHAKEQTFKQEIRTLAGAENPEIDALQEHIPADPISSPEVQLQHMRLGPKASYLCLIPSSYLAAQKPTTDESSNAARSPIKSWELLQPMSQGCLYHVQGWFTYSYCHGKFVKQFREAAHAHPHPPGGRIPEEDPEWESYYLGVSPHQDANTALVPAEEVTAANKLELARGAGQRYLVQRWDDGTICDKTGQSRKIEVQFHCAMTTTDKILFIKETSTCQYVLVIHTPRLCGEPGFKSERDTHEESMMRCREILSDKDQEQHQRLSATQHPVGGQIALQESFHPRRFPIVRKPAPIPEPVKEPTKRSTKGGIKDHAGIMKAIQALLNPSGEDDFDLDDEKLNGAEVISIEENGEQMFLVVEDGVDGIGAGGSPAMDAMKKRILEQLRATASAASGTQGRKGEAKETSGDIWLDEDEDGPSSESGATSHEEL